MKKIFICSVLCLVSFFAFATSIMADFYVDQDFDGSDLVIFSRAYDSEVGFENYNIDADFSDDGDVDEVDLGAFVANFGKTHCFKPEIVTEVGTEGGIIEVKNVESSIHGAKVEVPFGALLQTKLLSITPVQPPTNIQGINTNQLIRFEPDGFFEEDVVITIPYPDENNDGIVDGTSLAEINLKSLYLVDNGGVIVFEDPSSIDIEKNFIEVVVNHFSNRSWGDIPSSDVPYKSISGYVTCKQTGKPLKGVEVVLSNGVNDPALSYTNDDGFYIFSDLDLQNYKYQVELPDYYKYSPLLPDSRLSQRSAADFRVDCDQECSQFILTDIPMDSYGYSFNVYTAPADGPPVEVTGKIYWSSDWYYATQVTMSTAFIVETPFVGGSYCDFIHDHPENNYAALWLGTESQNNTSTSSIVISPGNSISVAGSDCNMSDNYHAHAIVEISVCNQKQ